MKREKVCYEEEVKPYRKTDYKSIIYIYIYILDVGFLIRTYSGNVTFFFIKFSNHLC